MSKEECDRAEGVFSWNSGVSFSSGAPASFGPWHWVSDTLASRADPIVACDPLTNDLSGKIAIISRGTCAFYDKILHAQQAGAVGAIILNNGGNMPDTMGCGGNCSDIYIPALMIPDEGVSSINVVLDTDPDHLFTIECLGNVDISNYERFVRIFVSSIANV